jgi:hypothetical protein
MMSSSTQVSVTGLSPIDPTFLCSKSILFYHNFAHCSFLHLHHCFSTLLRVHSAYILATYTETFIIFSVRLLSGYIQCDKC